MTKGPSGGGSVCLTFDDGPHPGYTPRLLDVLRDRDVPATFFLIGQKVEQHPDLVRREVDEGHLICNHTYSHADIRSISARSMIEEVRRTNALLADLCGRAPEFFRPPHGKVTALKLWRLFREGQTVVHWNVDPRDYCSSTAREVHAWFQQHPLRGGDLVLMHDSIPHAIDVLPSLIDEARSRGLTFTTPSHWID